MSIIGAISDFFRSKPTTTMRNTQAQATKAAAQQVLRDCAIAIAAAQQTAQQILARVQGGVPMTLQRSQQAQDLMDSTQTAVAQCDQAAAAFQQALQGPPMSMTSFNGKIAGLRQCIGNLQFHIQQNKAWLAWKNPYAPLRAAGVSPVLSPNMANQLAFLSAGSPKLQQQARKMIIGAMIDTYGVDRVYDEIGEEMWDAYY